MNKSKSPTCLTMLTRPFALIDGACRLSNKHFIAVGLLAISFTLMQCRDIPYYHLARLGTEARHEGHFEQSCQWRYATLIYAGSVGLRGNYIADAAYNLASIAYELGALKVAEQCCYLDLDYSSGPKRHLETTELLAEVYDLQGRAADSEKLYEEIAETPRDASFIWGRNDRTDLNNLAGVYLRHGKYEQAKVVLLKLLHRDVDTDGDSSSIHRDLSRLVFVNKKQNAKTSTVGPYWPEVKGKLLMSDANLELLDRIGQASQYMLDNDAQGSLEAAYKPLRDLVGDGSALSCDSLNFIRQQAYIMNDEGRLNEAEYLLRLQYKWLGESDHNQCGDRSDSLFNLATCLRRQGRLPEAAAVQSQAEFFLHKLAKH